MFSRTHFSYVDRIDYDDDWSGEHRLQANSGRLRNKEKHEVPMAMTIKITVFCAVRCVVW